MVSGHPFAGVVGSCIGQGGNWGWSHQESYHLPLPWAHRNIAFESLAFLVMLVGLKRGKTSLLFLSLLALTAFVYQVRGYSWFAQHGER